MLCTTEAVIKGNQATFLVADSGGASAVPPGVHGLLPARPDNLTQQTATLLEWHDLVRKTGFNVFASQGNQRAIMQMTTMGVVNRKMDDDILGELGNATNNTGGAVTGSLALVMKAIAILGRNDVPIDGQIAFVISPGFYAYLLQVKEFANALYVTGKPLDRASFQTSMDAIVFQWAGASFVVSNRVAGVGTSNETCFAFHKSSIGHAVDTAGLSTPVGYMEEQDYSWARATIFMGSKVLQSKGIVKVAHDGSAFG